MSPVDLVVLALCVSRLSRLVVHDSITEKLRTWVWYRWPASDTEFGDSEVEIAGRDTLGNPLGKLRRSGVEVFRTKTAWYATAPRWAGNLISCHWCASVWLGIMLWTVYWFYPVAVLFLAPLALSEVAGLLNDRE